MRILTRLSLVLLVGCSALATACVIKDSKDEGDGGAGEAGSGGSGGSTQNGGAAGGGGTTVDGGGGSQGGGAGNSTGGSAGNASGGAAGAATGGNGGSATGGTAGSATGGSAGTGGSTGDLTCTTGTLLLGNPLWEGEGAAEDGSGVLSDPPLAAAIPSFDGSRLYTNTGQEIWMIDLSAASPVQKRISGKTAEDSKGSFKDGPCATARHGGYLMHAVLPDHSLLVTDYTGNAIVKVTDPSGAGCAVSYLAGNSTAYEPLPLGDPPNKGDVDGEGAQTKLYGPKFPVADAAGNVYFLDDGNAKIKKLANDSAHTVSTVFELTGDDVVSGLAVLGDKLYLADVVGYQGGVEEYDLVQKQRKDVLRGQGKFPPLGDSTSIALDHLTTDGAGLIVGGLGYVWYLKPDATLKLLAGTGMCIDFPPSGYDPKVSHPAQELVLPNKMSVHETGAQAFVAWQPGALYYTSRDAGNSYFTYKIECQ